MICFGNALKTLWRLSGDPSTLQVAKNISFLEYFKLPDTKNTSFLEYFGLQDAENTSFLDYFGLHFAILVDFGPERSRAPRAPVRLWRGPF